MSFLNSIFGQRPTVPDLPVTNLTDAQQQAIAANKAAAPGAAEFADLTEQEILQLMRSSTPGFDEMRSKAGSNINDLLSGKIPDDVAAAVGRTGAARALAGGYGGSGMHSDLVARDLGLTSLNLMDKGLSSAESWMAQTERLMSPAMSNYQSMFVNPLQEYSTTNEQNLQQFQRQWMKSQVSSMPDPAIRGIQDTVMQLLGRNQAGPPNGSQYASLASPGSNTGTNGWRTADWSTPSYTGDLTQGSYPDAAYGGNNTYNFDYSGVTIPDMPQVDVSGLA